MKRQFKDLQGHKDHPWILDGQIGQISSLSIVMDVPFGCAIRRSRRHDSQLTS